MKSKQLLNDLSTRTEKSIEECKEFLNLSDEVLNHKSDPKSWSILECLEHLNRYGDFYIHEIEKRIKNSKYGSSDEFKSGWLGNYFAQSMLPKEKLNKMKTFKSMNPVGSTLNRDVIDKFISQQSKMLELLRLAHNVNLTKTKTSISISTWIKLRLGDTLRVVIYHNDRHIVQAKTALANASS